ncbi:MAG: RNA 2',3'-cyclic phosphodiesterase [Deltaproteobacteria bacterium]|nr:RNA 2',3'-cyclic phosphodiesterase [Deltaproteobacteria bacterium]
MIRTFIAIPLPGQIKDEIGRVIGQLRRQNRGVRWVNPENMHLTLKFLGNIDESLVDDISARLDDTASRYGLLNLFLDKLGCFPGKERPRVIWVGLKGDIDTLGEVAREIDEMTADFGVKRETRPFRAHITLGRLKFPTVLDMEVQLDNLGFQSTELLFFRSELLRSGARYTVLHRSKLMSQGG